MKITRMILLPYIDHFLLGCMHHSVTHACHTWWQRIIKHIIFHFISLGLDFNHRFITIFGHLLFMFHFDIISVLRLLFNYIIFRYYFPNYYFRFIELLCSDFFIINGSQKGSWTKSKNPSFYKVFPKLFYYFLSILVICIMLLVPCYRIPSFVYE